ncbi:MAG TPA: flagellar basal body P-ring protein FlgI [Terriglobales bacterium]|nr:flagellar basal body P-ring protein FlgI [Terriglobales bacterium]
MRRAAALIALLVMALAPSLAAAEARVKDVARVLGIRDNSLYGYGLVIGLNGTGDKSTSSPFTPQAIASMLLRLGIAVPVERLDGKNVAAVIVTAKLPPFARAGGTVDVTVSSLGDSTTLQGGTLLLTPLNGPDGRVYALAQGPVSVGGAAASGSSGDTVQKNHPTVGRIPNGAVVEREVPNALDPTSVTLMLQRPDATTAVRLAEAVNGAGEGAVARAVDPSTVTVAVPAGFQPRLMEFIARIEAVRLTVDAPARVIINERTGTIIMGSQLRISTVAIAHGNLTIQVKEEAKVSQPGAFAPTGAATVVVPRSKVNVKEEKSQLIVVNEGVSIGDIVQGLNALGVTPRDLISILQAIRAAGALMAELEII